MSFSYGKLRARIRERYKTFADFAKAAGMSRTSLSLKLNNVSTFTAAEITRICELLDIPTSEIGDYFFCVKSSEI